MKKIVFGVGGILLAALATGLTCVALASNQGRELASANDERLLIPTSDGEVRNDVLPWNGQERRETSTASPRTKNRDLSLATASIAKDGIAVPKRSAKEDGLLGKVVLPCLAGVMAICGIGLVVRGLRSRPAKRRKYKIANTAILAKNAGKRRHRELAVPATLSFSLANRKDRTTQLPLPQESEETKELRRAA